MSRKSRQFIGICVLLCVGVWSFNRHTPNISESVTRQQAMQQSLAPSGLTVDDSIQTAQPVPVEVVVPIEVDLADVSTEINNPDSMYNRWLRGEIDLDEREGIVGELEEALLIEESRRRKPDEHVQIAPTAPGGRAPSLGVSGASLDFNDTAGYVPPDLELAAGPNHLIAVVNTTFRVYNKSVTAVSAATQFSSFMIGTSCADGEFDPNVLYDESADRFILAIAEKSSSPAGSHYCVAVSQTGDPLGSWNIYDFNTLVGGNWMDYPHAGVGNQAIFMGGNMFTFGNTFVEGRVWAFPKALMYAGLPASSVTQGLGSTQDTPQPINLHGFNQGTWPTSNLHHILTETNYNGNNHTVYGWSNPFNGSGGTFGVAGTINLGSVSYPVSAPQSGGSNIQGNDWRPLDFEYRNGFGWTTMTVGCNPGGGTVDCIRWAQIDLSTITLGPQGSGVYSSSGDYRVFPDLAVNHCDDMAVGYSKTNSGMFPAVWVTGRQSGDTPGTLQAETQVKAGEVTYTSFDGPPHRWGDYTGMTIDPDGLTFWYLGEYSKNISGAAKWGSYISSMSYPCDTTTLPDGDAYLRDLDAPYVTSPGDIGVEPDPLAGNMWVSQDIWVRNVDDGSTIHQNPEFGQVNYVYARLRNSGPNAGPSDVTGRIHLYYAFASSGLAWPTDWTEFGVIPVPDLAAGATLEASVPWSPPGTGHYCVIARWVSDQDPMSFTEVSNVNTNTRNNNNIAWRNLNVVDLVTGPEPGSDTTEVVVRHLGEEANELLLRIASLEREVADPFLAHGELFVDLGELLGPWQANGGQGEGIEFDDETGLIQIMDPMLAEIAGLPMQPLEEQVIRMRFNLLPEQPRGQFHLGITQFEMDALNDPVGGVEYLINVMEPAELPVPPDVQMLLQAPDVLLQWPHNDLNTGNYEIWAYNGPYFNPGEAGTILMAAPPSGTTEYWVPNAAGDVLTHHFYLILSQNANGEQATSNHVGVFDFAINPPEIEAPIVPEY